MKKKLFFSILSCLIFICYFSLNLNAQAIICGEFTITPGNGTILIEGTSGTVYPKFEIVDQITWTPVEVCANCNDYTITGLADGLYQIKAFDVNWSPCVTDWFNVTNSGGGSGTDADGDGVTVEDGDCNDSDPNLTTIGAACDDGNSSTTGDVVQSNCTCLGSSGGGGSGTDADGDGVTVEDGDCNDTDPNLTTIGASCDDGNSGTIGDKIKEDCSCEGYFSGTNSPFTDLVVEETCNNNGTSVITDDILTISISPQGTNLSATYKVYDGNNTLIEDNIPYGTLYIHSLTPSSPINNFTLRILDGSLSYSSSNFTQYNYPSNSFKLIGCPCDDNDNDGICFDEDCDDNDPALPTMPGSICDDGDPNTTGEVIQADGCTCAEGTGGGNNSTLWTEGFDGIFTDSKAMVNDTLLAKKIIVQTDVFADYVFDINYPLLPLQELETYIQKNKHLPNIPPAAEVVEKGINVSELAVKQMEKIEELTLYIIQQQKEIEALKARINQIEPKK